jgi:hypothetical protein
VRERRGAVEHDSGPDEIAADLAVADHARRIRERTLVGKPRAGGLEDGELVADPVGLLGPRGEVLAVDDVARAAGTIGYELMCAVAPRVTMRTMERATEP